MEPNWRPLENRLGFARCAGFMLMERMNSINLYKHGLSRRYLNLADDGRAIATCIPGDSRRSHSMRR
jgi:hypothetical protein